MKRRDNLKMKIETTGHFWRDKDGNSEEDKGKVNKRVEKRLKF